MMRMKQPTGSTGASEPLVTTYRSREVSGALAEAIARTGAREGDGLVIEQDGEEITVRRVAPLQAGRVDGRHEFLAALRARLRL